MNENCTTHGGQMVEDEWAALLSETQHKGLFWCERGKHYVEVRKNPVRRVVAKVMGK